MEIAKYFATLGFKVTKGEIKKVDDFLDKIEKGLKTAGKEADTTDKATKKVKKSTDEATKSIKQQLTWQEKLNKVKQGELKLQFAIAQNQKQLAKNFKQSVDKMVIKPSTAKKLKEQQALYDNLFGGSGSRKTTGATGSNQAAWNRQFNQRIQQLTQQSKVSRAARQADLDAVFGLPKAQSNPRVAALLNDRLGYLGGTKNDALADMAAMYRNEEKIAKLKTAAQQKIEESEQRILSARQRDIEQRIRNAQRRMSQRANVADVIAPALPERNRLPQRTAASVNRMNYMHAGGAVGALARYGVASLPFVGGVYGLSAMNQGIQDIQSTEIAAGAIFGNRASESQKWLESQADRIGFNYLETMPIFSSFMASSMPLMGYDSSRDVFQSLSEFGRTRGADSVSMKRAMTAIQQMASKGQIMAEELKGQLSEAKGFGEARQIFAEAYQISTGGSLTGTDAAAQLMKDMQDGKVKAGDILPIVGRLMKERAAGGISQASKSLTAEQMRFQNEQTRQLKAFSESGGMEAYTRIFKAMTVALKEAEPFIRSFSRGFNEASKFATEVLLDIQSIQRFFQGRDSYLGDLLLPDAEDRTKAFEFMANLKTMMGEMSTLTTNIYNGWSMLLAMLDSSSVLEKFNNSLSIMANAANVFNNLSVGNVGAALDAAKSAGQKYANTITAPGRAGANVLLSPFGVNIGQPFPNAGSGLDAQTLLQSQIAEAAAQRRKDGFQGTLGVFPMESQQAQANKAMNPLLGVNYTSPAISAADVKLNVDVKIEAATVEDFNEKFRYSLGDAIKQTLTNMAQKE